MNPASASPPVLWYTWVHGHENYHAEAMAMLLSCMGHKSPRSRFRVYTDRPEWYAWLAPHVEVETLSEPRMKSWGLDSGYLPRIKANLIEMVSAEFSGHTVWLDTDMWAVQPLAPLEEMLDAGHPIMYFDECIIAKDRHGSDLAFRAYFNARMPELLPGLHQYNSGVTGLPFGQSTRVTRAIEILDDVERYGNREWVREQMAMSVPLSADGNLRLAECFFRHYCGGRQRRRWQPLLKQVLFQMVAYRDHPEEIATWIRMLPASEIPLAGHRRKTWLERKTQSVRKLLGLSYY